MINVNRGRVQFHLFPHTMSSKDKLSADEDVDDLDGGRNCYIKVKWILIHSRCPGSVLAKDPTNQGAVHTIRNPQFTDLATGVIWATTYKYSGRSATQIYPRGRLAGRHE